MTHDRWRWIRRYLPKTRNEERLLDVGCGTGAFTIAAARIGYHSIGLTWDRADTEIAQERARICGASKASFRSCDVRRLHGEEDLAGVFDYLLCCENIEHILDERKLMLDMTRCLKAGGRLLLTAPNYYYRPISSGDEGPFEKEELGWHVRRGYSEAQLKDLFNGTGLILESVSYCGGFLSQKLTAFMRMFDGRFSVLGWALTMPFRLFVPLIDPILHRMMAYPHYSICAVAYKAKYS